MIDDDDLPILTHVLRTGNAPLPLAVEPVFDEGFHDHFDIHPFDDGPLTRQIVIGHDPQDHDLGHGQDHAIDDAIDDMQDDDLRSIHDIVADPREVTGRDAFGLSQDADARQPAHAPISEPPIVLGSSAPASQTDTPIDFSVPSATAEWAARVRDSVVADLTARIDTELDARIANALHLEVETTLAQLQERLRAHLSDALRDVVARAVDEEILRIRSSPADLR